MTAFVGHEDLILPDELGAKYVIRSCLRYSEQAATYLLCEKSTDRLFLLKTASDPVLAESLINENNILEHIHQERETWITGTFPSPVSLACYSADGQAIPLSADGSREPETVLFYIRTYIEGKTLEELCETNFKKPGLPPERALDYLISLTELLHFLHTMHPPLIHRDIKPQNVVIDSEGTCHFIDLGISRFYHPKKRSDTFIMGTKLTAPPEQFGYQQTDMRSDLYSLGILLYYCITGEYNIQDQNLSELPPDLAHIIRKLTMFDPGRRYQSTDELLPDLLQARYTKVRQNDLRNRKRKYLPAACVFLLMVNLALAFLCGTQFRQLKLMETETPGYSIQNPSEIVSRSDDPGVPADTTQDNHQNFSSDTAYTFAEPLIEEAVRAQLSIPEGPVTVDDLSKITELHIFGLYIYSDDEEVWLRGEYPLFYNEEVRESSLYKQKGTIRSLEDITHMPNLDTLSLYRQQISDISLLKDTKITHLGIGYNPLTDLSPLAGNPNIVSLTAASLEITDTSVLSTLTNLVSLNISNTGIRSLEGLENCHIEELNLYQQNLDDYSELNSLPYLKDLTLDTLSREILTDISQIPLVRLSFHHSSTVSLEDLSVFSDLECLDFFGSQNLTLEVGTPSLPSLRELCLTTVSVESFEEMSCLENLETLAIYGADCKSFDGLDRILKLHTISCQKEQYEKIHEQYPDASYVYLYS